MFYLFAEDVVTGECKPSWSAHSSTAVLTSSQSSALLAFTEVREDISIFFVIHIYPSYCYLCLKHIIMIRE